MIRRGEIWWALLGAPLGSGPGSRRPVLVAQANDFNESSIRTVVGAAITSSLRLAGAPGNVLCRRRDTGPSRDSVINVSQVLTIDTGLLTERVGTLPSALLEPVEEGLRLVLAL